MTAISLSSEIIINLLYRNWHALAEEKLNEPENSTESQKKQTIIYLVINMSANFY